MLIFCIGMSIVVLFGVIIWLFLLVVGFVVIGIFLLLVIYFWVSFVWGMGVFIGISIGGILMVVIFGLISVGEKVWVFVLWIWLVKLGMFLGIYFIKEVGIILIEVFYFKVM